MANAVLMCTLWAFIGFLFALSSFAGKTGRALVVINLLPVALAFFFACRSSAQELTALVVNSLLKGVLWTIAGFLSVLLSGTVGETFVCRLGLPNGFLGTVVLACLHHRHVRKTALYNFCSQGLFASSFLGWTAMAGGVTMIDGMTAPAWLLWTCSGLIFCGGFLANQHLDKRTSALIGTSLFVSQALLQIAVAWHSIEWTKDLEGVFKSACLSFGA